MAFPKQIIRLIGVCHINGSEERVACTLNIHSKLSQDMPYKCDSLINGSLVRVIKEESPVLSVFVEKCKKSALSFYIELLAFLKKHISNESTHTNSHQSTHSSLPSPPYPLLRILLPTHSSPHSCQ